jgi:RNA recognition motif-containing protein
MTDKLYVGNVPASVTVNDLRQLFSQAGTVTALQLLSDNDGAGSTNYAHLTMDTPAATQRAIQQFHGAELAGSRLAVTVIAPLPSLDAAPPPPDQQLVDGRATTSHRAKPGRASGGYQSNLSAFGGKAPATPPRRRGRGQRR